ncbi:DUF4142 domain-containing protein [Streptomyces sp. ISL-11]|uniref:DUF4142 domain-containing protein n=1 Tax=Streptomyces sp. ISL-11 TaxID=2819174 RepID=UPI001BE88E27|nr:DUF4142 domain-containing protein [Streptomyces sp. ISL-11]MBT2386284.1 DUF4142 domain-containing protein [Streptomyces sp. ISL-11]
MRMRYRATTAVAALALAASTAGTALAMHDDEHHDGAFLKKIHQGNLAEIAAGKDAGKHATTRCVKDAGALFVRDHTKLDEQIKKLAHRKGVTLPTMVTDDQRKALKELRKKAGTSRYDRAWLNAEEMGHKEALKLIDHEIDYGKHHEVRELAEDARPTIVRHLDKLCFCKHH